jgi:hypothetical protein
MTQRDWNEERQRLKKSYAGMSNEELQAIAPNRSSLTEIAQEELLVAMKLRGMQSAPDTPNRFIRGAADAGRATETSRPVLLAQYFNVLEAMLAKSILQSSEIESFVANSNVTRLYWLIPNVFGGVKLFVRSDDLEAAKSILEQRLQRNLMWRASVNISNRAARAVNRRMFRSIRTTRNCGNAMPADANGKTRTRRHRQRLINWNEK